MHDEPPSHEYFFTPTRSNAIKWSINAVIAGSLWYAIFAVIL